MEECPECGKNKLTPSSYAGYAECEECDALVCNKCGEADENGEPYPCDICGENVCAGCGGVSIQDDNLEMYLCAVHNEKLEAWLDHEKKMFKRAKP